MMRSSEDFTEHYYKNVRLSLLCLSNETLFGLSRPQLAPTRSESLLTAMRHVRNPRLACEVLYQQVTALTDEIRSKMVSKPNSKPQ